VANELITSIRRTSIRAGRPPRSSRRSAARLGWLFSSPALFIVAAVTVFPIVFAVVMSLSNVQVLGSGFHLNGFTLSNFRIVFSSSEWQYALAFTVVYTIVTVTVELILGTMIALVLERLTTARAWMMALLLIPWSLITAISAQLWGYIYDPTYGVADAFFSAIGLGRPVILGQSTSAITALMVADIWKTTPFVAIIVLAGLVMIPAGMYEAAAMDGANGWTTFWRITLPLLRPTIAIAILFRVLQALGLFDLPFILTGGGPGTSTTSLAVLGYQAMFNNLSFGPGAAVATTTALLVTVGCLLFFPAFKSQANARKER
jgi:multiple sugar transport system permease protein